MKMVSVDTTFRSFFSQIIFLFDSLYFTQLFNFPSMHPDNFIYIHTHTLKGIFQAEKKAHSAVYSAHTQKSLVKVTTWVNMKDNINIFLFVSQIWFLNCIKNYKTINARM